MSSSVKVGGGLYRLLTDPRDSSLPSARPLVSAANDRVFTL